jgi:hypothetical protein
MNVGVAMAKQPAMVTSGLGTYATDAEKKKASRGRQNTGKKPRKSPARKASTKKSGAARKGHHMHRRGERAAAVLLLC